MRFHRVARAELPGHALRDGAHRREVHRGKELREPGILFCARDEQAREAFRVTEGGLEEGVVPVAAALREAAGIRKVRGARLRQGVREIKTQGAFKGRAMTATDHGEKYKRASRDAND